MLIDDLEVLLGKEAVAKIKASPVSAKLAQGDELLKIYTGADDGEPKGGGDPKNDDPAPNSLTEAIASLNKATAAIQTTVKETVHKELEEVIKTKGFEMTNNASMIALRNADELNRVYRRHERDFPGEDFDSTKFNEFVETEKKAGKSFKSVTEAYEAMVSPRLTEKKIKDGIETGVRDKLKDQANQHLPGVTPPSGRSPIAQFQNRDKKTDGSQKTAVDRAAGLLEARLSGKANESSL